MSYVVTVDTSQPVDAPGLEPLQRAGVVHLLREGLEAIGSVEGEGGKAVEITDHFIGVHPDGALLKIFVDAPSLEDAEAAVEAVITEILQRSELLGAWTVDSCEVQLHLDSAEESLDAADGLHTLVADPTAHAAVHHHGTAHQVPAADTAVEDGAKTEAAMRALAPRLAGIGPAAFGHRSAEDLEGVEEFEGSFNVPREDAELAAGAIVYGIDLLIDELFEDLDTLGDSPSVAECEDGLLQLEGLPMGFAHLYTPLFARKLLVTAITLTDRLCRPDFGQLTCVAEELLLRLLLETTEGALDLHGLLDHGVRAALESFRDTVYEDLDHEWLYNPVMDGIDQDRAPAHLGIAPMSIKDWFTPFAPGHPVHPYASNPAADE